MTRIEEIKARLESATATPWDCDGLAETGHTYLSIFEGTNKGRVIATGITRHEDADLLLNAPEDIAYLLAELRKRDEVLAGVGKLLPIIQELDR
jgi:hypothetical protein